MDPIDIVLPWVDDTDPIWKKDRNKYLQRQQLNNSNNSNCFRDWDTLRYVFRGIEQNMPWIRYIHFITCGHLPAWLNTVHPKIKIHRHKDFFSIDSALPTFSSHAIEMNFSSIPELAEKFIYFNDDTLVVKPTEPERFFKDNKIVDYLVFDIPRYGWLYDHLRIKEAYGYICRNDIKTVERKFQFCRLRKLRPDLFFDNSYTFSDRLRNRVLTALGLYKWIKINHNPQAFFLSKVNECVDVFHDIIVQTSKHRFRSYGDVNQYIYRFYTLSQGDFLPHYFNDDYCLVLASQERYKKERKNLFDKTFICLNDSPLLKAEEYPALKQTVDKDLNSLFPTKSDYEI